MQNQVPEQVKGKRAKELRDLSSVLRKREFSKRVETFEYAVTENNNIATTDSYFTIKSDTFSTPGELLNVKLVEDMFVE